MSLTFEPLHPVFAAEVRAVDLSAAHDPAVLAEIRAGMDRYGVLVFRDQPLTDDSQRALAVRIDGTRDPRSGEPALFKPRAGAPDQTDRFGTADIAEISNVDHSGQIARREDSKRLFDLGNRLWHTDASFIDPAGRYSMLHARVIPPEPTDTEFCDLRAAYDDLDAPAKSRLEGLAVRHSIAYSRRTLGFEFAPGVEEQLTGATHPLVRELPRAARRSLYLGAHASHVIGWPVPEGRILLMELTEHATRSARVYRHRWRAGDLVIWDNRATVHRATAFDDRRHRRELRRVTTLDVSPQPPV